jgi:hypothetical protein
MTIGTARGYGLGLGTGSSRARASPPDAPHKSCSGNTLKLEHPSPNRSVDLLAEDDITPSQIHGDRDGLDLAPLSQTGFLLRRHLRPLEKKWLQNPCCKVGRKFNLNRHFSKGRGRSRNHDIICILHVEDPQTRNPIIGLQNMGQDLRCGVKSLPSFFLRESEMLFTLQIES